MHVYTLKYSPSMSRSLNTVDSGHSKTVNNHVICKIVDAAAVCLYIILLQAHSSGNKKEVREEKGGAKHTGTPYLKKRRGEISLFSLN